MSEEIRTRMEKTERVVVAMSGGVDSSVAAALLVEAGYDVIGMMMRLWSEPGRGPHAPRNRCCTPDQMADARRVAAHLKIPFYVVDVRDYFRREIVQFFIDEHRRGRTPNPCLQCNRRIRFGYLLEHARSLGATYLATGHYARIRSTESGPQLLQAVDESKDQSYVLYVLGHENLGSVLFPVGEYRKEAVRAMAAARGLPVAQKSESMDLCFLGDGDHRRFLNEYAPQAATPGPILASDGTILGEHQGLLYYTIGQRKGLGISTGQPLYVLYKDVTRNALVVGPRAQLGTDALLVRDATWLTPTPPTAALTVTAKIRYQGSPAVAKVTPLADGHATVQFAAPVFGATAGQGVTFYDGPVVLGGGIIADAVSIKDKAADAPPGAKGSWLV